MDRVWCLVEGLAVGGLTFFIRKRRGSYRQRSLDEYVLRFSFLSKMVSEVITRGWCWCTSQIGISRGLFTFIF